jgi:hypothetical protein
VWGVPDRARANWNAWYGGSGRIPSHISSSLQGLVAFRILLSRPWDVCKPCPCFHQHATSSPGIASISSLLTRLLAVRTSFRSPMCGLSAGRRKQLGRPLRQPWRRLRQEQQGQRQQPGHCLMAIAACASDAAAARNRAEKGHPRCCCCQLSGAHTVAAAAVREDGSEAHQLRRRWTHPGGSPRAAPGAHLALFLVHRD